MFIRQKKRTPDFGKIVGFRKETSYITRLSLICFVHSPRPCVSNFEGQTPLQLLDGFFFFDHYPGRGDLLPALSVLRSAPRQGFPRGRRSVGLHGSAAAPDPSHDEADSG